MAGGESTRGVGKRKLEIVTALATEGALGEFSQTATCMEDGRHSYPALAGLCPSHADAPLLSASPASARPSLSNDAVPPLLTAFINSKTLFWMDNGKAPRWNHAFGYETRKIGVVNHIPVAKTLAQLTAYFTGGNAQGSTHFGVGRGRFLVFGWENARLPLAEVHQYMPVVGPVAPWAQGVINCAGSCRIQCHPRIAGMRPGEPNGAFVSIENVDAGEVAPDDAQFNSNVFLRAWTAAYFGHEVSPNTQLWHSEIDRVGRCGDPPWSGAVEDEMQEAARKLLRSDLSGLRAVVRTSQGGEDMTPEEQARLAYVEKELERVKGLLFGAGAFLKDSADAGDRSGIHYHEQQTVGRPTPKPT